ncbi:hypothetical protein OPV22_020815 [Ensete ventricosum]|uniref:Uncharacterized protein n=1 Tax=Ensete ventricosum TaxID=4639 RepID=A0AAV8QQU9_ENSVE|nr:hypothetical protein OPV22_020815 [Ensete ventricosum]
MKRPAFSLTLTDPIPDGFGRWPSSMSPPPLLLQIRVCSLLAFGFPPSIAQNPSSFSGSCSGFLGSGYR